MPQVRRVAHILPFPGLGGTEYATLRIAKAVASHEFESIIVCLHDTEILRKFVADAGLPFVVCPTPVPSVRHGKAFLDSSRAVAAEFKRLEVQLVHCADALAGYHVAFAGYLAKLPVLCHIRNRHPHMERRVQLCLRPVTHFAFVSKESWRQFPLHVPEAKGTVIYDGIDPVAEEMLVAARQTGVEVRAEFGLPPDARIIGMVARVAPQKDYETLIAAAAGVVSAHPEARFMMVGDFSTEINLAHYEKLRGLLEESGMASYFIFTGYRSDVPRFLDAFDIAVLSTHQEGLPLVLLEGMARAKPTVATAVDGIPELIDGSNGLLYPHADVDALAARLLDLLDHPETCARLGRAARQTVLSRFSTEKFTSNMVELYQRMFAARG